MTINSPKEMPPEDKTLIDCLSATLAEYQAARGNTSRALSDSLDIMLLGVIAGITHLRTPGDVPSGILVANALMEVSKRFDRMCAMTAKEIMEELGQL
jgi:hypothetical protein